MSRPKSQHRRSLTKCQKADSPTTRCQIREIRFSGPPQGAIPRGDLIYQRVPEARGYEHNRVDKPGGECCRGETTGLACADC